MINLHMLSQLIRCSAIFFRAFASVIIFSATAEKRKHFCCRAFCCIAAGSVFSVLIYAMKEILKININSGIYQFFALLAIYLMVIASTAFCYKGTIWSTLISAASGYAMQDISGHIKSLVLSAIGVSSTDFGLLIYCAVDLAFIAAVYGLLYAIIRPQRYEADEYSDSKFKGIMSLCVMMLCIGMGRIVNSGGFPADNFLASLSANIYAVLVSSLVLVIIYGRARQVRLAKELDSMRELMHYQKVQYESHKENVQLVNEKYHDMKKLISGLKKTVPEEQLTALEKEISDYDTKVTTGNDVLDVILTESCTTCNMKGITLTCTVDGSSFAFVEELDLYTLMTNLLSNAVEAVEKVSGEKYIILTSRKVGNLLTVHEENPCSDQLRFQDGLPMTEKDSEYHGFGMRSMERCAQKYHGGLRVQQENGVYKMDILLISD